MVRRCGIVLRMTHDTLVTTAEVAEILGKSARTVQRMADAGTLPVAQRLPGIHGAILFRRDDVLALIPERAVGE